MAKQPNHRKSVAQGVDRQNVAVKPPKGAESKSVSGLQGGGNMTETVVKSDPKSKKPETAKEHAAKFTREQLESMKMASLRKIGDTYGVKDNIKSELIDKIMEALG